jgi:saccharopine dehydrogenase-like NADP-dependent oxidoreductase
LTQTQFRVLVLGGYGNFGQIIVRKLSQDPSISVVIAGRDLRKAQAVADETGSEAACVDGESVTLTNTFTQLNLDLVISTAGPFQHQHYQVAQAAIDAGIHYVDIADARAFVCGIDALDAAAKTRNVLVVSGASSVPALSSAVLDELVENFQQLHEIDMGITSSEVMPGLATVRAVLGYIGKPFQQWRDGKWHIVHGWQDSRTHRFFSGLGTRWFGNCDIPDLDLFARRYPGVRTVRFQAGLGLRATHFATWFFSWCVRSGLFTSIVQQAPLFLRSARLLQRFGSGRSGMFVRCSGIGLNGKPYQLTWELVAAKNHGVNVPCMAAVALARKLAAGNLHVRGATPCVGLLELDEYLDELQGLAVVTSRG